MMRRTLLLALSCVLALPLAAQLQTTQFSPECTLDDDRIAVMLIGSYHMANPGLDSFNLEADDILTPERQAEIERLVGRLGEFGPTKVAIEVPFGDSATTANYHAYLTGAHTLTRSESQQIGFRLAKQSRHAAVYPVDVEMLLPSGSLGPVIGASAENQARMGQLEAFGTSAMAQLAEWLTNGTIGEMLYHMNEPDILALAHQPYLDYFAPMADGDNYAGADFVGVWMTRNLRIFANLARTAEPGDRVVLLYGQGHIPLLQQFVEASPAFCHVDPRPYLAEAE